MPILAKEFRVDLCKFIRQNAAEKGIIVDMINGVEDHLHALTCLVPAQSVADVMKQIKGASSHRINEKEYTDTKFNWQQGCSALSISPRDIETIRKYIKN